MNPEDLMTVTHVRSDVAPPEVALLRLLLEDPRFDPDEVDWSTMLELAQRQGLTLRLADWFARRHEGVPAPIAEAFAAARQRQGRLLALVARLEERCARFDIPHVFLTIAQQYPDLGRDIDLLVDGSPRDVDAALLDWSVPQLQRRGVRDRLAATTCYPLPECGANLVIQHRRMGRMGEHGRFAWRLLHRRRRVRLAEVSWSAPTPEHGLLVLMLHRLYGQPSLRLRDAHWTITTLRRPDFDWDMLWDAAHAIGVLDGLSCYLNYIEQIHLQVMGAPLVPRDVRRTEPRSTWGQIELRDGNYRFAQARVAGRLYFREFCADLAAGNWDAAGRLLCLPVVAAAAGYKRLTQPIEQGA